MGYAFSPRSGSSFAAAEIVHRLRSEFRYVDIDAAEGTREALALADWIEARPERVFMGKHLDAVARGKRLRSLAPDDALRITFGDDPRGATLRVLVLPKETITFGYASKEEEKLLLRSDAGAQS